LQAFWTIAQTIAHPGSTDVKFEPPFAVELAKAGDSNNVGHFARPFGATRWRTSTRATGLRSGRVYKVQCSYCGKTFTRKTSSTRLNPHSDGYGNRCYGRVGIRVL
jgi:hypothetical protein